jgi:ATP-dependent helicase/nuclease subunit A
MSDLVDDEARAQIRSDLGATLIVEAAAGTGKTTELVHRIMALLTGGKTTLARIVAVTFTEKAAGEMKLRLRGEIERARRTEGAIERERLDLALAELEEAHIGTIHSFCAELLRQRPVEARVDPMFEVLDEDGEARSFGSAFDAWFETILAAPPEGVRRVLRRKSRDRESPSPREVLRKAGHALLDQRDFDTPWRRDAWGRTEALDGLLTRVAEVAAFALRVDHDSEDWLAKGVVQLDRFARELERREAIRGRDYDGAEQELRELARQSFWRWKGRGKWLSEGLLREDVVSKLASLKAELDRVLEKSDADLAACLHEDLAPLVRAYESAKARQGRLDFLDLLLVARNLVRDDDAVRAELQERFTHLLVDEFQDTDPLQAEILLLLAADDPRCRAFADAHPVPGKLFIVGDPKQSIYRFRRADVTLYEATKQRLIRNGAVLLHLSTSFRSAPSIQAAVNAAFAPLMQGSPDGSQATYVPLQPFRAEPVGRPTIVALPIPRPYTHYGKVAGYAIDKSLPDAVGAFVDWLIHQSGWTVTERERPSERVPIVARHICLLTRRFVSGKNDVTRDYVRALEVRHIPHVLVGGRSYHQREEVVALRNALTAIEWPDDELSVFATLHGPFLAIGDDALLAYRHALGAPNPVRRIDEALLTPLTSPVAEALRLLRRLHSARNRQSIGDTIGQLLDATRAHAGIAIWPNGEQALANVLRMQEQARRFEAAGASSFRAFIAWLDDEAERRSAAEAPVVEEGTDGVRVMTVYKAKGLEFPVVILIDPTCPPTFKKPSRYVDTTRRLWATPLADCAPIELVEHAEEVLRHDADEAVRLTYVGATRARELLVVPVVGDEPFAGWVDVLHPVLYPHGADRRAPLLAQGCPPFGDDSVVEGRPVERDKDDSVAPGLHRPKVGSHAVTWWDPAALALGKREGTGLRQQRILAEDITGNAHEEGTKRYGEWEKARADLLARGVTPTLEVRVVTRDDNMAATPGSIRVDVEATAASGTARPGGARFGTLVHAVLAGVPLDADQARVETIARTQGTMLGATNEEVAAAVLSTMAALAHPIFLAAKTAGDSCRREAPVLLAEADGSLVEGVLDLAYRVTVLGTPEWVIVDYKTDAELAGRQKAYEEQVRLYARAVGAATGEATRGVLLRV